MNELTKQLVKALQNGALIPHSYEYSSSFDTRGTITMEFWPVEHNIPLFVKPEPFCKAVPAQLAVERVIYADPATIVYWGDGTKTIVKCHEGDMFDERTGFLLCCAKKLFGNTGRYNDVMKKHAPETTRPFDLIGRIANALNGGW